MKIKLITTDPTLLSWESLPGYKAGILRALNKAKNANFELDIEYRDITPEVYNGRVTHEWFDTLTKPLYIKEVYFVGLHMGDKQRKQWGIKPSLRGSNHVDNDNMGDFYFWADEKTKRNGFIQFVETFLHEMRHEICRGSNLPDDTHALHEEYGTITKQFYMFDMAKYRPKHQATYSLMKTVLRKIVKELQNAIQPDTWKVPEVWQDPFPQWDTVTQAYGVKNKTLYPLTGLHWGTDFATPIATPIKAMKSGKVTRTGHLPNSLGYWFEFLMDDKYYVFCHLQDTVEIGSYAQGEIIGYTGNTGYTKGVHCHVEGWYQPMDRSKMNKNNLKLLTFDVYER